MKKKLYFAALLLGNLALITHNAPLSVNPSILGLSMGISDERRRGDRYWWNKDLRDWSDDLEIIVFRQNISQSDLRKLNIKIISYLIHNQTWNVEISVFDKKS